jgi:hypothetical protein
MSFYNEVVRQKEKIRQVAAARGAINIRLFGSVIRGEENPESDLDILVEFEPGTSLLDHIALIHDLEDLLGRKVDVVSEKGLHWFIRDRILQEAIPL